MSFLESWFLWIEAVVASIALATACAYVGVYMVMRRVVFLPATISQVAGLGVALTLFLTAKMPMLEGVWVFHPVVTATAVALVVALGFGWMPEPKRISRETLIGVAYILASALVILVSDLVPQEAHDIKNVLYGNAVAVERSQMWAALGVSGAVLALHLVLRRPFLLVSFDRETAGAHGVPVAVLDGLLFLTLGLLAAQATRTIGAMPVFAFSVLPAAAALALSERMSRVFGLAAAFGASSALFGYWLSFVFELPTGSCMAALSGAIWLGAVSVRWLRRKLRPAPRVESASDQTRLSEERAS